MILSVKETFDGRGGKEDAKFETQFQRVFVVESDVMDEDVQAVKFAVDPNDGEAIPAISDPHPEPVRNQPALATAVRADQRTDSPFLWTVTVEYSTVQDPSDPDPLLRLPKVSWNVSLYQKAVERATLLPQGIVAGIETNLQPVVNSAGDPFDPPIMVDDTRIVLTVTKNFARFPRALIQSHVNCTNRDVWYGFPVGTIKLMGITAPDYVIENNVGHWPVTFEFHVRWTKNPNEDNWLTRILDAGMREIKAGKLVQIYDNNGSLASSPVPLDGSGAKLDAPNGPFRWRLYRLYESAPFGGAGGLGLDDPPLPL